MCEAELQRVAELMRFLQPSFPSVGKGTPAYENMAALLADVSLQAGIDYHRVVRPRVQAILAKYRICDRTQDVVSLLQKVSAAELLQWRNPEKLTRFTGILRVLVESGVGDVRDLALWLGTPNARRRLLEISGVGDKTFDYLRLLCGIVSFPIDRHFARFLRLAGVDVRHSGYERAQQLLLDSCVEIGIEPHVAERSLWLLLRACV